MNGTMSQPAALSLGSIRRLRVSHSEFCSDEVTNALSGEETDYNEPVFRWEPEFEFLIWCLSRPHGNPQFRRKTCEFSFSRCTEVPKLFAPGWFRATPWVFLRYATVTAPRCLCDMKMTALNRLPCSTFGPFRSRSTDDIIRQASREPVRAARRRRSARW